MYPVNPGDSLMSNQSKERMYGDLFYRVLASKDPGSQTHRLGVDSNQLVTTYNKGISRIQDQLDRQYQRHLAQVNKESYARMKAHQAQQELKKQ